jgi:hypothetical protein
VVDVFSLNKMLIARAFGRKDHVLGTTFSSGKDKFGFAAPKSQLPASDPNGEDVSGLSLMDMTLCSGWGLQSLIKLLSEPWLVLATCIKNRHGQELLPGIAIHPQCGVIDVKEVVGSTVENPHRVFIGGECHPQHFALCHSCCFQFGGMFHSLNSSGLRSMHLGTKGSRDLTRGFLFRMNGGRCESSA